jgi:glutamate-1-semialdehyde 2,1-aminomutase
MTVHFSKTPIRTPADAHPKDRALDQTMQQLLKLFHLDMIDAGIYLARRGFVALSLPMREADTDRFEAAVEEFLAARGPVVRSALG